MASNLASLLTEKQNPLSAHIDTLPTRQVLEIINQEDQKVAAAVAAEIQHLATAVDAVVERLRQGGRLFYAGAGTSGRLGVLDAAECPPTYNVPPDLVQGIIAGGYEALVHATEATEDDPSTGARDLLERGFDGKDALVGIAASGRTPYVLGAIEAARQRGGLTIGISCTPESNLSEVVHIPIALLVGPEVVTGSTRMKAGTATKLALNMLSTAVMIRLGYVYGNLMVNVQPKNVKLADRARRIICTATGVSYERAAALLEAAGNVVKTAIVMELAHVDRATAERRLETHGGRVADALRYE